jgi:hypothetical protein
VLPYIEEANLHSLIDFDRSYTLQPEVTSTRVELFLCRSEQNTQPKIVSGLTYHPSNYAANFGVWFIHNPNTQEIGSGPFAVNKPMRPSKIEDGLSKTLGIAEVKANQAILRDGNAPNTMGVSTP